ncbi:MAG TPA: response regulator transcription factor [Solirubrobacterales bacterium]|nr:response regulator transcription factor [Solirubrobacterales bacterium]
MQDSAGTAAAETLHKRPRNDPSGKLVLVDAVDPDSEVGSEEIRVLIAHADKLARAGLHAMLDVEGIAVSGSAADGEEAVALAAEIRPDVVLIDITMPGVDGVEVTRRIVADPDTSGVHVLILSVSEQDEEAWTSLRAGASGFLPRDTESTELADGVRAVAAGEAAVSAGVVRRLIAELASQPDPRLPGPEQLSELTPREREVMRLVAAGLSNDDIAEYLVISRATAKTHVSRALGKLHARDRAQLVTLAYETGLVLPKQPT